MSTLRRSTRETTVVCSVRRGAGSAEVTLPDRFLSHMVETLARYAGLDVTVEGEGDLRHHLVEDVAITFGLALRDEVPEAAPRYGWAVVPMDEALAEAAVDLGGRPFFAGELPSGLYTHFLHSFATNLGATLHVRVLRGRDRHHQVEAAFKAVGLALRQAAGSGAPALDRPVAGEGVFSTKGAVRIERLD